MAETRNYNYGGVTPFWTAISSSTHSTLAADQSYTQDFAFSNTSLFGSGTAAAIYMAANHPASGYRGNYIFTLIDSISGFTQYYFQRVHSDVVTASYNGQAVHRVVYNGDTVFQRQINFGNTVDNVTQVTRTISSLTFRFTNTDGSGIPVNVAAGINTSSSEPALSVIRSDLAAGSTYDHVFGGLSHNTTYFVHNRLQPTAANPSILASERHFESWTTVQDTTETPTITAIAKFQTGSPLNGIAPYQITFSVRSNEGPAVSLFAFVTTDPSSTVVPTTLIGTIPAGNGTLSSSINTSGGVGATFYLRVRTQASGYIASNIVQQSV